MQITKINRALSKEDNKSTSSVLAKERTDLISMEGSARAMFIGLALGDALGWPTEFKKIADIYDRYGNKGIQEPPNPAEFTDDTQMTIAIARSLSRYPWDPIEILMKDIVKEFVDWGFGPENNRAPGLSCMAGVRNLAKGVDWKVSGGIESRGCGAAMRVAPVGFLYQDYPDILREVAIASSQPTHRHPSAVAAAVAAAYLVKMSLDKIPPHEMLNKLNNFISGMSEELDSNLNKLPDVLKWGNQESAMEAIGGGWDGCEAVPLALYCVMKYPDSWIDTVRRGANFSGDSDSIASIAGGIQAARLGLNSIPEEWISRLERKEEIEQLALALARAKTKAKCCL